ncbi:BTB/POZ domain-containing protein 9 [Aphelenchoides bicaudatus]|nr:BTB/POZ domain-containing protein 9 [Aphelenchoides bicaudatus]
MRLSARLQFQPRRRLPLRIGEREQRAPSPMSNNHYNLIRASNSDENLSMSNAPDYLSSICDDNSLPSTSGSSFYEFSDVTALLKQIETLYSTEDYSDVTLIVENERFPAHRVILACRSTYFRAIVLLKYIYSGRIRFQSFKFEVILDVFVLAHKFVFADLEIALCDYLKHILHHSNVAAVYALADFYQLDDLALSCTDFMDKHAEEVLKTDAFVQLSGSSLHKIFARDSFCVPEIEIFNIVSKWIQLNPDDKEYRKLLLDQVRLPLVKIEDLLSIVRPTGFIDSDKLLDTINDQTNKMPTSLYRGCKLINTNVCTLSLNAHVIEGDYGDALFGNTFGRCDTDKCARHDVTENERKAIVVELGMAYILNYIELCLLDRDQRSYSYYVEVSVDQKDWTRVADYTKYTCRLRQQLYFPQRVVKFIKIVGVRASTNRIFYLTSIKAMFTNETNFIVDPETTLLKPLHNVATISNNANVIEGVSRSRNALLNGEYEDFDWDLGYTCHQIGSGSILIQLPQPYLIDSIRLRLWDLDDRLYSFQIDVSLDFQFWETIVKAYELRSWQSMRFKSPIPIVFLRITGTFNTANEVFHLVHIEIPANPGTEFNKIDFDSSTDELPLICGNAENKSRHNIGE